MQSDLIYLDEYVLQRDMRIRLPKSILENMQAVKGETMFSIYYDKSSNQLVLRKSGTTETSNEIRTSEKET